MESRDQPVGNLDKEGLAMNYTAPVKMLSGAEIRIVQGADHRFEAPATLDAVGTPPETGSPAASAR